MHDGYGVCKQSYHPYIAISYSFPSLSWDGSIYFCGIFLAFEPGYDRLSYYLALVSTTAGQ